MLRMSCGREFQRQGAEWLKALDPMVKDQVNASVCPLQKYSAIRTNGRRKFDFTLYSSTELVDIGGGWYEEYRRLSVN